MPIPTLETQRLLLRPFRMSDAPGVQSLAGVPEVALTTQTVPYPYEDGLAQEWIASLGRNWDAGTALTLAMTSERDGLLGAIGLHVTAAHRRGELGFWVGLPFWNRGYATEAAAALLDFGFNQLHLNRIQARHMTRNPSSGRVMEKLGMKPEGIHRQYMLVRGTFEDIKVYAMLRSEHDA